MAALLKYWPIIVVLLNALVAWFCWSLRQLAKTEVTRLVEASEARLAGKDSEMDVRLDGHHDRLLKAEGSIADMRDDISNLPTKADLARVEGEIKSVGDRVGGAAEGIKRLEGYFLAKGVESV